MSTKTQIMDAIDLLLQEGYKVRKITPLFEGDILTHDRTGLKLVVSCIFSDGTFEGKLLDPRNAYNVVGDL